MPAITVQITGFEELHRQLAAIPGAAQAALLASAAVLSREGTEYWRGLVTVRTGRMRASLSVQVQAVGGGVQIRYAVGRAGFYYRFQRQSQQWSNQLANYLAARAPRVISAEFERALARI